MARQSRGLWQQRVQLSRGHWHREERGGAVRSAGCWESVAVTWSSASAPDDRPPLAERALVAAAQAITPAITEMVAARAQRFLGRQVGALLGTRRRPRTVFQSSRRHLPVARRELPR